MQTMFKKESWHRFEYQHMPIYIRQGGPDGFIPNSRGRVFYSLVAHFRPPNGPDKKAAAFSVHALPNSE
jgi:hypothetical protein